MKVEEFEAVFRSLETSSVLGGLTYSQLIQQALDDIFADDMFARLELPQPFAQTTAVQQTYTWAQILPTYIDVDGITTIRRIKGLWDPSLSPSGPASTTDYGRAPVGFFEQKDINRRVYDGDVYIDQERKLVKFKNDPLTTTDKWNVDMYLDAPIVGASDQIPLLKGWERRLLIPGVRSWFEELDKGEPGIQAKIFHDQKLKYRSALEREREISNKTEELGITIDTNLVKPL